MPGGVGQWYSAVKHTMQVHQDTGYRSRPERHKKTPGGLGGYMGNESSCNVDIEDRSI